MIDTSKPVTDKARNTGRVGHIVQVGTDGVTVDWEGGGTEVCRVADLAPAVPPAGKSWPPGYERK